MLKPGHNIKPEFDETATRRLQTRFQLLFAIFAALPIVAWLVFEYLHRPPSKTPSQVSTPEGSIPETKFTDIAKTAGINFVHSNGALGEKLLPETMGGGCAFFDFDNDGDQDLLLVNSKPDPASGTILALYQNDGHGNFTDVTPNSGLQAVIYGMGVATGDFDNDGLVDLFITGVGENKLFRNLGAGKFQDVTARAGFTNTPGQWSASAAWIDFDNDGDLDLFVCNYVKWTREIDLQVNSQLPGIGRAYARPMNFPGSFSCLYRNDGKGHFADISAISGIQVKNKATGMPLGKSLGIAPVDIDGDGWIDLIVANDTVQNFVFHNEHNGTFKEIGAVSGLAFDAFGAARGAMGIDTGRFQDENSLGVSIGNFANEMTALYVAQRDPLVFSDEAIRQGIGSASRQFLTFGVFFFDYDLDGWLDLLTVNGHIEPNISKVLAQQTYEQPAQLYWNARSTGSASGFIQAPPARCGPDIFRPMVGRGSAYADIDGDGDLDVVITQINGPPMLLRNDQNLHHHWIKLKLNGLRDNHDSIGTWVRVRVGNRTLSQQVMAARGYLSQSELPITIGLGTNDHVDEFEILWPSGIAQKPPNPRIDALTVVNEPK